MREYRKRLRYAWRCLRGDDVRFVRNHVPELVWDYENTRTVAVPTIKEQK